MMYFPPKTIQIETGLLQAVALNLTAADAARGHQQRHATPSRGPRLRPVQPPAPEPAPSQYAPAPQEVSWQHNLAQFLALLNSSASSRNAYNDHAAFAAAPVLAHGWRDVAGATRWQFHPGRGEWLESETLAAKMGLILRTCGFDEQCPVLFDRCGRILDGYHRLLGAGQNGQRVYFLQLDF